MTYSLPAVSNRLSNRLSDMLSPRVGGWVIFLDVTRFYLPVRKHWLLFRWALAGYGSEAEVGPFGNTAVTFENLQKPSFSQTNTGFQVILVVVDLLNFAGPCWTF